MSEQGEGLLYFPGVGPEDIRKTFNTEYAEAQSPIAIDSLMRLGLSRPIAEISLQHASDLHLIIVDDSEQITEEPTFAPIRLGVASVLPDTDEFDEDSRRQKKWIRTLKVGISEIGERINSLQAVLPEGVDDDTLAACAIDWIFAEEMITVANNSWYMYKTYGKYIEDFNGQSPYHKTQLMFSIESGIPNPTDDYDALRSGFGLMFLHTSLIARGVIAKTKQADWALEELRRQNSTAMRHEEVESRLAVTRQEIEHPGLRFESYYFAIPPDELSEEELDVGNPDQS